MIQITFEVSARSTHKLGEFHTLISSEYDWTSVEGDNKYFISVMRDPDVDLIYGLMNDSGIVVKSVDISYSIRSRFDKEKLSGKQFKEKYYN